MKKLLSIILALAMILSTIIIPTAIVVGAEEITVLTKEYYVSNDGNDETGDGSAENPYATIAKAESVAAALENETTIVNATINIKGVHIYGATVAHKGMFTIKGVEGTNPTIKYLSGVTLNGALTLKDLSIPPRGNHPTTNGHEFIIDVAMTATEATSAVVYKIGNKNNTETSYTNEKMTVINNTKGGNGHPSQFMLGGDNFTYTGGIDFVHQAGFIRKIIIAKSTFKGNVNITVDSFTQRTDDAAQAYQEVFTDGAVLEKALQVIYNNNSAANIKTTKVFETDAVTAAGGKWVMYGKSTNGTLTTTETAGTFKVNSTAIARAENKATGEVYYAENGYLTVPAGVYDFSFGGPAVLYVSATGSDETGDGTEANPYATVNKATEVMANNIVGTIYVSGEITTPVSPAAHVGMITIEGVPNTNAVIAYGSDMNPNGPLTIKNVTVKQNGNNPYTNGHEFIIDITKGSESNTVAYNIGTKNTTADNYNNEKMTVINNTLGDIYRPTKFEIGVGAYTGSVDFLHEAGHIRWVSIQNSIFKGNVNITFDSFTQRSDEGFYSESVADGAVLEKALQVIYNNNSAANIKTTKVFETDAVTAAGGKWVIYGDNSGGKLRTTETAGTFKVIGPATAIATNAEGTEVISENGLLTLPAGVWNVTYDYRVVYVSEKGSDETGDGSETNPYASIKKAMSLLSNKAGTVYVMGNVVISDIAHTGMITIKGYDENSAIEIKGPWCNQIFDAFRLSGPMTLEDLRIIFTHIIVTQGQALHIKDCWTTGKPHILVGHYQQNNHTTGNELKIDGLEFMDENNLANSAPWNGLTIRLGSFGGSTNYNTNDINISLKNTNLKAIDMSDCIGTIKGDVKIAVDNSVLLCTDGAYRTKIDDSAVEGNFEFISNGKGLKAFTGITASDNDLTHVAVTEGNGIWFLNGATGSELIATETAGSYKVTGPKTAVATNEAGDSIKSIDGILTVPAGTWDVYYETTEVYVSANGSADGDGSKDQPLNSLNTAMNMLANNPEGGTIYVSGKIVESLQPVAHKGMITIEGVPNTNAVIAYGSDMNPNGPLTIKNVTVKQNGNNPYTNGHEFIIDITKGSESNTVAYNIGTKNTTADNYNNEKMTVINNTLGDIYRPTTFNIGAGAYTGSVDFLHEAGFIRAIAIQNSIFKGNVNITVDSFTQRSDEGFYKEIFTDGAVLEKALQVIYNNNSAANIKTAKVFETDAVTAQGGKWIIYGAEGGKLRTTETAGKFTVTTEDGLVAVAKADGAEAIVAENGVLDLTGKPGVYTVTYIDATVLLDAIYVSATEGNDNNIGSEEYPVATLKVAIEKAKNLMGDKVIYIMGTVPTLVNGAADYVTYSEMITFKGYDANSALEFTTSWKNQVNQVYMFQGPTTLEGLRLIINSEYAVMTNGNEVVINNCYMNTLLTFYVGDHQKSEANAKVNKLTVNGLEFFNETFSAEAPWLGLNIYYGAFGGDDKQVESGDAAKFATAGVEVYINGTNLKAFRFDSSRGYISGDVKLTVDKAFIVPLSQGGYRNQVGSITEGVLTQPNVIKGAVMVAVNNNIGTETVTGTYENAATNNLSMINAEKGEYFVYSADINGNTMAIGDAAGEFDIVSDYSVDVKDAEGNVVKRASDVLNVEEGTYYVTYFNAADINADGKLDIRDLVALKNELAKEPVPNYAQFDISADGKVNTEDLASFQKYFLNVLDIKFEPVGDLAFTYFEDVELASNEFADVYKETIYAEKDSEDNEPAIGGIYYVSSLNPNSTNKGTEENPFTSIEALNDAFAEKITNKGLHQRVLFERGSVFRTAEALIVDSNTFYGAYGEGDKPQILGSLRDYADASLWTSENGGSIWQIQMPEFKLANEEASNIVVTKNGVEGIAKRANSLANVDTTGEYYYDKETGIVYLFCDFINPAKYFDSIEISTTNCLIQNYDTTASNADKVYNINFTIENLCVKYAGIHTFALSRVTDSTIQYCEIGWAGGHHTPDGDQRYGNGVEFWDMAQDVNVSNNHIYQSYDAAVTFQGSATNQYINVVFALNLIERCSYGFEFWAGAGVDLISVPEVGKKVTQELVDAIVDAEMDIIVPEVGSEVTEDLVAAIQAKNDEIQAKIDEEMNKAVITGVEFSENVNRLAAGGMGGVCRPKAKNQSFIQPFNFDATTLVNNKKFEVNIIGNIFDTSYRSFVWGTGGTTEEDPIGSTIKAMNFEGNVYLQNTEIAPDFALINGVICETDADFEKAVKTLDKNPEIGLY